MCFRTELSLAGRPHLSQEANLKFMGHFFSCIFQMSFQNIKQKVINSSTERWLGQNGFFRYQKMYIIFSQIQNYRCNFQHQEMATCRGCHGFRERALFSDGVTKPKVRGVRRWQRKSPCFYTMLVAIFVL